MPPISRRSFIRGACATMAGLALPRELPPLEFAYSEPLPASLGRIATWWRQAIHVEPDPDADVVTWKTRDEVMPLYAALGGTPPWPTNPIWYQTDGGFIHSGYIQPVEEWPSDEVIQEVVAPGFWAKVCVPSIEARPTPGSAYGSRKLYYGTIYRVIAAVSDEEGAWWYQLKEGITYSPGPYVPSWAVRRILPEDLTPISPDCKEKWIEINIDVQLLTCYEGDRSVFVTRTSTGLPSTATPRGEHAVLLKRGTSRMIGGSGSSYYDLPGVPFPVYFTWSGVAIHGTYWHNDYGRRHSHGCVNVTPDASQWIYRWCEPLTEYSDDWIRPAQGQGLRVVVV